MEDHVAINDDSDVGVAVDPSSGVRTNATDAGADESTALLLQRSDESNSGRLPFVGKSATDPLAHRYRYYSKLAPGSHARALIMPEHIIPEELFVLRVPGFGSQSSLVTILSVWNTMLGTSLLVLPWAISQAGIVAGVVGLLLIAAISLYTCEIILDCGNNGKLKGVDVEYPDLVKEYLGPKTAAFSTAISVLILLGASCVFWVLMSQFLYHGVTHIVNPHLDSEGPMPHWHRYWSEKTVPIMLVLVVFPLLNLRDAKVFTKFNSFGVIAICFVVFVVVYFVAVNHNDSPVAAFHFNNLDLARGSVFSLTGVASLSFFIHNGILSIVRNAKDPTVVKRDVRCGYALATATYLIVGVLFYLGFVADKREILPNFLNNFDAESGGFALVYATQWLLLLQIMATLPLIVYILRFQVLGLILGHANWPGYLPVICLNATVCLCCVAVATWYADIGRVLSLCGGIGGFVEIFCLPAMIKLESLKRQGKGSIPYTLGHALLVAVGLANAIGQFL
eukprot:m.118164 g.118164  ORF g.118164 m.118164 type:complete len:508 (+) comp16420_c0_seq5:184-1707(+)